MALDLKIKIYQGDDQPKTYIPEPFAWNSHDILAHYPFQPCEDFALDFIMSLSAAEFLDWFKELLDEETICEDERHTIKRIKNRLNRKEKIMKVEVIVAEWDSGFDI